MPWKRLCHIDAESVTEASGLVVSRRNANCGPTALAMAVKAFGLEEPRASNNPEDSIDLARNAMTLPIDKNHPTAWDTLAEPATNDVGNVPDTT